MNIIVFCGESSTGKDTFAKEISKLYQFENVVSSTTRPMREKEVEGIDYYFLKRDEFENGIINGDFLEFRAYDTINNGKPDKWYYGTNINAFKDKSKTYVLVLDLEGLNSLKKHFENNINVNVKAFYIYTPEDIRKERAKSRDPEKFSELEFNRRAEDDRIKFAPNEVKKSCDFIVDNSSDNSDICLEHIKNFVETQILSSQTLNQDKKKEKIKLIGD